MAETRQNTVGEAEATEVVAEVAKTEAVDPVPHTSPDKPHTRVRARIGEANNIEEEVKKEEGAEVAKREEAAVEAEVREIGRLATWTSLLKRMTVIANSIKLMKEMHLISLINFLEVSQEGLRRLRNQRMLVMEMLTN